MKRILSPIFVSIALSVSGALALFTSYAPSEFKVLTAKKLSEQRVAYSPWVEEQIKKLTIEEKIGQFFMMASNSNKGENHFVELEQMITDHKIGGVIFFQGDRVNLKEAIDRYQAKANLPLLIAMDAEWGVGMRLTGEERYPYNYTLGAADDTRLTREIGAMIAQECRELGIHVNFAPVADVNSNPANPVIGFRSYGEQPRLVARHVAASVVGMESQGVMTSIKHFPGHGDTDVDSHYDLPVVNNTYNQINAIDFAPFRAGVNAGTGSVMIGHLNVPALDPTGTPTSLSKRVIHDYLKGELEFNGLVISDALRMKAVADRYGKTEAVVMAFEAGIDILLIPESLGEAIDAIKEKVLSGAISQEVLNDRLRKVLQAKYDYIISPKNYKKYSNGEKILAKRALYEKAFTVIKNENDHLPIRRFDQKIAIVSIGSHVEPLHEVLKLQGEIDLYHAYSGYEAKKSFLNKLNDYDLVVTIVHTSSVLSGNKFGLPKSVEEWINAVPSEKKDILVLMGNPLAIRVQKELETFESIVIGYENHEITNERMGQFLLGGIESSGKLPVTVNEDHKFGAGLKVAYTGRLKDSQPEEVGIDPAKLSEIDTIVWKAIKDHVFPGCQIAVAKDGKLFYHKAFGKHTYEGDQETKLTDLYDIASITKVAASTTALMTLESKDLFTLDATLENYLPELTRGTSYASVRLKDMLAHQAGFTPWIPFYKHTMINGDLRNDLYSKVKTDEYSVQVTPGLYIKPQYADTIYQTILKNSLSAKKYKYSDIGYYFIKKIVEKQSGAPFEDYLNKEIYRPLGLHMCYNPLRFYSNSMIAPTENDLIFRKEQIHGTVHDQGAAMLGGVGGHAGLFSNARDLAQLMQLFLNKGTIAGVNYIEPKVVEAYTGYQYYPSNRRGAGFDKPVTSGTGGPCYEACSKSSFGHSGFTGTLVWTDPEYNLTYVFLSNRVYPDAENWKIVKEGIRTEIQRVIYEAIKASK